MFLNPLILTGLAAASVPLLIHLLARARFRSVEWAAMMFLDGTAPPQQQTAHFKGAVLLTLRMGIVALLAMALAQPILRTNGRDVRDPRASAVILLDRSASMAMDDNGRTRLDLARDAAYQVLGEAGAGLRRRGDEVWMVPLGSPDPPQDAAVRVVEGAERDPAQTVATRVQAIAAPAGQADVAAGLAAALDRLEHAANSGREIYIICDRQALSWERVDADFITAFHRRTAGWPVQPSVFVIPIGGESTDNVAIESVQLMNAPAIFDQPAEVEVRLRNYGPIPRAGLPLTLAIAAGPGEPIRKPQGVVNVPAHATTTVRLPISFTGPGSHLVSVELARAPGIPFGQRFDRAVDVLAPLRTLIITGDEREKTFRSSTDFLRLALAPYKGGRRNLARVEVLAAGDWSGFDLDGYQIVILANVAELTPMQARTVEAFVYGGGGLLIAPGDLTHADNYDKLLGRAGHGILPAQLGPEVAESESATTSFAAFQLSHPIFEFLRGRPDPTPPATVQRFFPAVPHPGAGVLASYANGKPFLIESPPGTTGRGRVLLATASLDADATTLPLTGFFLPFVQSAARYLAGGTRPERNLAAGRPLVAEFNEPVDEKSLRVRLPAGSWADWTKLQLTQAGLRSEVRYPAPAEPGAYLLQAHVGARWPGTWFVIDGPRQEVDPAPLTEERWRTLEHDLGFERLEATRRSIATAQTSVRGGRPLWLPLLAGVIALSVLELAMARLWCVEQSR